MNESLQAVLWGLGKIQAGLPAAVNRQFPVARACDAPMTLCQKKGRPQAPFPVKPGR
jgi:hypothetical protein